MGRRLIIFEKTSNKTPEISRQSTNVQYPGAKAVAEAIARIQTKIDEAYKKPASGIPKSDLSEGVRQSLDRANTAYKKPVGGIPASDLSEGVRQSLDGANTAYQKPADGIPRSDLSEGVRTSLGKADTALQEHQSLAAYVNAASYDSVAKKILLKHDDNVVAEVDAKAFVKDGMVSTVKIEDGNLVVTFNTDAGKQPIAIPLSDIFDSGAYYDKEEADDLFATKAEVEELRNDKLFAQYYPDGSVKSAAEFTPGIKYDDPDTTNLTITVKPFCNTGTAANDNSNLSGRVVIPPFVDGNYTGYVSDDGTRYKVVGVSGASSAPAGNSTKLTGIIAPNTVTSIGVNAFRRCNALTSASLPSVTTIGNRAFSGCSTLAPVPLPAVTTVGEFAFEYCLYALTSVSLPSATTIEFGAFYNCTSLTSVSLPSATTIGSSAFGSCAQLTSISLPSATTIGQYAFVSCGKLVSVDFGGTPRLSVPTLGTGAFNSVPAACKIIVPDAQYDAWTAATNWSTLYANGYQFLKHSEWEYARRYELDAKADAADLRYSMPSSPTVLTPTNDAATFAQADRTVNWGTIATSFSTLNLTFPAAIMGKVRNFLTRITVAAGVTAPDLALPQGVRAETNAGTMPTIADGETSAAVTTILSFTEQPGGTWVIKSETVKEVVA